MNKPQKDMINSFFFNYSPRKIQEYFEAKMGRKIRIFSLARKKQDFILKKECNKFAHEFRSSKCPERDFNLQHAAVRPS